MKTQTCERFCSIRCEESSGKDCEISQSVISEIAGTFGLSCGTFQRILRQDRYATDVREVYAPFADVAAEAMACVC